MKNRLNWINQSHTRSLALDREDNRIEEKLAIHWTTPSFEQARECFFCNNLTETISSSTVNWTFAILRLKPDFNRVEGVAAQGTDGGASSTLGSNDFLSTGLVNLPETSSTRFKYVTIKPFNRALFSLLFFGLCLDDLSVVVKITL